MKTNYLAIVISTIAMVSTLACDERTADMETMEDVEEMIESLESDDQVGCYHKFIKVKHVLANSRKSNIGVLSVENDSLENRANIVAWEESGWDSQKWTFFQLWNGYWMIVNQNSYKCLEVAGGSTADGANIRQNRCRGWRNQQFEVKIDVDYNFEIINRKSQKCVTAEDASGGNGENISQQTCMGTENQKWAMGKLIREDIEVVDLWLYDAEQNTKLFRLEDGIEVNLSEVGTKLTVVAETEGKVGSVVFSLDSVSPYRIENFAPYAIKGDNWGDFKPWTPSLGAHTVKAAPFSRRYGRGQFGMSNSVRFEVTQ